METVRGRLRDQVCSGIVFVCRPLSLHRQLLQTLALGQGALDALDAS